MSENTHALLSHMVKKITCKPGWSFSLQFEDATLRLVITVAGVDSYNPENPLRVAHFFPVPMDLQREHLAALDIRMLPRRRESRTRRMVQD